VKQRCPEAGAESTIKCVDAAGFAGYALPDGSTVAGSASADTGGGGTSARFCSTDVVSNPTAQHNPTDPLDLTDEQARRVISFYYENVAEFELTLSVSCCSYTGRNFLLAGKAATIEDCPAPPGAPPSAPTTTGCEITDLDRAHLDAMKNWSDLKTVLEAKECAFNAAKLAYEKAKAERDKAKEECEGAEDAAISSRDMLRM